jgi:large subunit ribosomal protein L35
MPKMKTHKGAKSRFKITGTGKIRRRQANLNHFLGKKPSQQKRRLEKTTDVHKSDTKRIRRMLGQ